MGSQDPLGAYSAPLAGIRGRKDGKGREKEREKEERGRGMNGRGTRKGGEMRMLSASFHIFYRYAHATDKANCYDHKRHY